MVQDGVNDRPELWPSFYIVHTQKRNMQLFIFMNCTGTVHVDMHRYKSCMCIDFWWSDQSDHCSDKHLHEY